MFIIHCWGGTPDSNWYQWLGRELEAKGFEVHVPEMPNTDYPKIEEWVPHLAKMVGNPDEETYLVGHSMGVQAILRYLETLKEGKTVGGALFVAGFVTIKDGVLDETGKVIFKPWLGIKIDFKKVIMHSKKFTSIFSGDDMYIPLDDAKTFEKELKSKIIIIPNAGHFTEATGYMELHIALNELLKIAAK